MSLPEPGDPGPATGLSTLTPVERAKLTAMLTALPGDEKVLWHHQLVLNGGELQLEQLQCTLFDFNGDKDYRYQRDGDLWKIQFGTENGNVIHETGAEYVAELLKNPHKERPSIIQEGARGKTVGEMGNCYGDELTIRRV